MSKKTPDTISSAVRKAYADCTDYDRLTGAATPKAMSTRNINFRSAQPVGRDEAIAIMAAAIPDGYNEFDARLLWALPISSQVTIAREGSVCIYVKGQLPEELAFALRADELSYDPTADETRIWWD